jgi:hypothetical protein
MIPSRLLLSTQLLIAALLANPAFAQADDCPDSKTVKRPFIVERRSDVQTEIIHLDDGLVRTALRSRGSTLLETTEFQGLFQLDRIDRGRRRTLKPKTDLKSFFPLKVGQKIVAEFETEEAGKVSNSRVELTVKKADTLYVGSCKYSVLQIEKSEARGEGDLRFLNVDYYSPVLKLVIAKEYKERNGAINLIKYDRIYFVGR